MGYVIGIDIGGSTTKIVCLDGEKKDVVHYTVRAGDPITSAYGAFGKLTSENRIALKDIDHIMCTGVGASFLSSDIFGIPLTPVNEFTAIGLGGKYASGFERSIVVSMGTGTAFVSVEKDHIQHICGTGVGGGTLLGLGKTMLGATDYSHIIDMAKAGDLANVDLHIGDISRVDISNMSAKITASNFGKVSDTATHNDLALGILNMVLQTVGIIGMQAAKLRNMDKIILTGNLSQISIGKELFDRMQDLYGVEYIVPDKADYATALGAALYTGEQ